MTGRFSWMVATFALLLQRTPLIKVLAEAQFSAPSRAIQVWQWAIAAVAGLAAYDTVAGATTIVASPSTAITKNVGEVVFAQVTINGSPGTPQSWSYTGTLPNGVGFYQAASGGSALSGTVFNFNSKNIYIRGTATQGGTFPLVVKGWENSGARGGVKSITVTLTLNATTSIPPAPASITASDGASQNSINLSWPASSGATFYQVFRSSANDSGTASQLTETSATQYTDSSLSASSTFYYWVKAGNTAGISEFSTADMGSTSAPPPVPPPPPTNLAASDATSLNSITVSWTASVNATTYQVYRNSTAAANNATLLTETTDTQIIDQSLPASTIYYYWVTAGNNDGYSELAGPDMGSTSAPLLEAPQPPTDLAATDANFPDSISITWSASASATSYEVWTSVTDQVADAQLLIEVNTTSTLVTSLPAETTYYYFVRARNGAGVSAYAGPEIGSTSAANNHFQFTAWLHTEDGFVYNQMGFLYDGFFPFVYVFSDENWIYIFTDRMNDTNGFYLYDFKRSQFGYTEPAAYPYYYVIPANGAAVDLNPSRK